MLGVERAYALTLVWHLYCIYAMQAEVDHFVGMARKQIETLWKQYVTSECHYFSYSAWVLAVASH